MQKPLDYSRRTFLAQSARAGGILALPHFASLGGAHAADEENQEAPRRLVVLHNELSFYNPAFFPEKTGKEEEKVDQLLSIEDAHMKEIGRFLDKLATTKDVNG